MMINTKTTVILFGLSMSAVLYFSTSGNNDLPDTANNSVFHDHAAQTVSDTRVDSARQNHDSTRSPSNEQHATSTHLPIPSLTLSRWMAAEEYNRQSAFGPLPDSLAGRVFPVLKLNESGQLIADESLKNLIEMFLKSQKEEDAETLQARLREYLAMILPEASAAEANQIVDAYLAYQNALPDYSSGLESYGHEELPQRIKAMLDEKKRLRREYLGNDVAQAMFKHEEAYTDYAYERMLLNRNTTLSETEKLDHLQTIATRLPERSRERVLRNLREEQVEAQIRQLRGGENSADKIYQIRKEHYGEDVAKRLHYLEDKPDDWQFKVIAFEQESRAIRQSAHYSEEQKAVLLNDLRNTTFSEDEKFKLFFQRVNARAQQVENTNAPSES